jgi:5-methylcytosine-specific restriction endonuclease McrA
MAVTVKWKVYYPPGKKEDLWTKWDDQNMDRRVPTKALRAYVMDICNHQCVRCGEDGTNAVLNVDHIIPWSAGGLTIARNLQVLCWDCNIKKASNLWTEPEDYNLEAAPAD